MNLTRIAIERPSLIIVLFSLFALLGIIGYQQLSYELMPDFNQPVIVIRTGYPGALPEEVETSLSRPVEDALAQLEGVEYLATKSLPNASVVIANMEYGTDLDKAMVDAQRYIDNIAESLPEAALKPVMSKVSPNDLPMMSIAVTGSIPTTELTQLLIDELLPRLQQIKGVAEIDLLGGQQRAVRIDVDPGRLQTYGIGLAHLAQAVGNAGLDMPAGALEDGQQSTAIRLSGKYNYIRDIETVQLAMPAPNSPVYIPDLAAVYDGTTERESISRFNGKEAVSLLIKKQGDANSVDLSANLRREISKIEEEYRGQNLSFHIADDSTDNTIAAVESVIVDLSLAVLLVALVMLLFLHSFRNALIVLIAIPSSLITAFAVMWLLGYTLNLMTLLAMSLIIGILVDDAVVVLENIQRHLDMGKGKRQAAMDGRMEIGYSAISITLVDVVVFLPILFLQVFVADMLKQFSVVVISSTLTSLLVGFTLTPWLASRFGKSYRLAPTNSFNRFLLGFENILKSTTAYYGRLLDYFIHHKWQFSLLVIGLFMLTGAIMQQGIIGKELIATGDQGKFRFSMEYAPGTALSVNDSISVKIEDRILRSDRVFSVFSNVGGPVSGIGSLGVGSPAKTELTVQLSPEKPSGEFRTELFMKELRQELAGLYPDVKFSMSALGLVPRSAPVELTISGPDRGQVTDVAATLRHQIERMPGADNVRLSVEQGDPELLVTPDREKMQRLGISMGALAQQLRIAFAGTDNAVLTEQGVEYPVITQLAPSARRHAGDIARLPLTSPGGQTVALSQFAKVNLTRAPSLLERRNRQAAVSITADALGRPSGSLADDVVAWVDKNPLPKGIALNWGGDIQRQHDSFSALGTVLLISFLLIYLILVALYDNFLYPFVALFSIPVAAIGAFLALNLSMSHLSLFALLGMIMLMGLVTKNAILIVDFTNQLKAGGMPYRTALVEAGKTRMRAILMTTLSMAIGMFPIALASGTASEWKNGLAWVIIGGLLSSLVLTVFIVPVVYDIAESLMIRVKSLRRQRSGN